MSTTGYEAHNFEGKRKYLTRSEGVDFLKSASLLEKRKRLFCEVVYYLGCRITEAINLTGADVDPDQSVICVRCLKKRGRVVTRRIPVPRALADELTEMASGLLWPYSRSTAWRIIKGVMNDAGISGIHATAKGLRHAFGVRGALGSIPVSVIQRWMGHASPLTTSIYLSVWGDEERALIERTWDRA